MTDANAGEDSVPEEWSTEVTEVDAPTAKRSVRVPEAAVPAGAVDAVNAEHHARPSRLMTVSGDGTYGRRGTTWLGVAVGLAVIAVIVIAVSALATELSPPLRVADPPAAAPTPTAPPAPTTQPAAPLEAPTSLAPGQPVALIGSWCTPGGDWLTADGSVAHCVQLQGSTTYLWSLQQESIPAPTDGSDAGTAVCAAQTGRSPSDCTSYLSRRGYHGPAA